MNEDRQSPAPIEPAKRKDGTKRKRIPRKITLTYLKNSGAYYLQRFPASTEQFRKIMRRKIDKSIEHHQMPDRQEAYDLLETVVKEFQEFGYLNDEAYAASLVRSMRNRGNSATKIRAKLHIKGVSGQLGREEIKSLTSEASELVSALRLLRKRRKGPFSRSREESGKSLGLLARNGFSYQTAMKALEMPVDQAEEYIASN